VSLRMKAMAVSLVVGLLGTSVVFALPKGVVRSGHHPKSQQVKVSVTEAGFVPATVSVKKGVPIILLLTRKTENTCATQAVFPAIGKTVDLPLNRTVHVSLPAQSGGRMAFACGMGMFTGELVVQ
jgi:plastocyanin domain-containing protein